MLRFGASGTLGHGFASVVGAKGPVGPDGALPGEVRCGAYCCFWACPVRLSP